MTTEPQAHVATKTYLVAAVLAAAITALGHVAANLVPALVGDPVESLDSSGVPPGGALTQLPATGQAGAEGGGGVKFGRWSEQVANKEYLAATDGFVAALTGGNSPADEFVIQVGEIDETGTIEWRTVTRALRYDGTVCPVPRGNYWRVVTFADGSVSVNWLPVLSGTSSPGPLAAGQ